MIFFLFLFHFFLVPSDLNVPLMQGKDQNEVTLAIPAKFQYLDEGRQTVACIDGSSTIVLKFFKKKQLQYPWYLKFPIQCLQSKEKRIDRRICFYPQGYMLAQKFLPKETGVLYVHQNESNVLLPTVLVKTRFREIELNLNEIPFVVQKKAGIRFLDALKTVVGTEKFQFWIDQYLAFHQKRISFLIADDDKDILNNYYLSDDEIQYIDPARFYFEPKLAEKQRRAHEWGRSTQRLKKWIQKNAPGELAIFEEKIREMLRYE